MENISPRGRQLENLPALPDRERDLERDLARGLDGEGNGDRDRWRPLSGRGE